MDLLHVKCLQYWSWRKSIVRILFDMRKTVEINQVCTVMFYGIAFMTTCSLTGCESTIGAWIHARNTNHAVALAVRNTSLGSASRVVKYFLPPALERIKITYCMHGQETLSIFVNVHVFIHCIINIVCISFCLAAFWRINSPIKVFIWYTTAQLNDQQWLLTLCSNDSFVLVSLNFLCDNTAWQQTTTRSNRSITTRMHVPPTDDGRSSQSKQEVWPPGSADTVCPRPPLMTQVQHFYRASAYWRAILI